MSKLKTLSEFILDENTGIYAIPGCKICTFSYSDGGEDKILRIVKSSVDKSSKSMELEAAIDDWPTRYHFSNLRTNIIRALEYLDTGSRILEIGAGCGAVTRYLGEYFKAVDSIEGDPKRAYITRERTKGLENVRVYCSELRDVEFDAHYDIVTLIGVLEYSTVYYTKRGEEEEEAALAMLKHAVNALKEHGILILAIENKLGLKYWSGCRDDHTGRLYDGIHGYVDKGSPITFSRSGLIDLLQKANLKYYKFYYPFPDYKLADTIFREVPKSGSYYLHNWINTPFEDYMQDRDFVFNELLAAKSLFAAGILYDFANSFLVVASREQGPLEREKEENWIVKRFSTNRIPAFRVVTVLQSEMNRDSLVVRKRKLLGEDEPNRIISMKLSDLGWIPGDLLQVSLCEAIFRRDCFRSILVIFSTYHEELLRHYYVNRRDEEGYPLLKSDAVDFVPGNIVVGDQGLFGIDQEWVYHEAVSADFVLFRAVFQFVHQQYYFLLRHVNNLGGGVDNLLFSMIQSFYPQYTEERHNKNKTIEEQLQCVISGRKVNFPTFEDFKKTRDPLWQRDMIIKEKEAQIQSFENSLSWKITSPLRCMLRMLTKG